MFTSRAEFRLSLRADNADQRLTPLALDLGCVSDERQRVFEDRMEELTLAKTVLGERTYSPKQLNEAGIKVNQDGNMRTGIDVLAFPDVQFTDIVPLFPELEVVSEDVQLQVMRDSLYANYIDRQAKEVAALKRDEQHVIPNDFDYRIDGLSNELRNKLEASRPVNLAQAARINGMTPAALALLLATLKRQARAQVREA